MILFVYPMQGPRLANIVQRNGSLILSHFLFLLVNGNLRSTNRTVYAVCIRKLYRASDDHFVFWSQAECVQILVTPFIHCGIWG